VKTVNKVIMNKTQSVKKVIIMIHININVLIPFWQGIPFYILLCQSLNIIIKIDAMKKLTLNNDITLMY
jgi:hypothetical protein